MPENVSPFLLVLVPVAFLLLLLCTQLARGEESLPALILHEFHITQVPKDGLFVVIAGRPEGLWAAFMHLLGMGTETRFEVTKHSVRREVAGGSWYALDSVPLGNVASVSLAWSKRLFPLLLGIIIIFISLGGFLAILAQGESLLFGLFLAGVFFVAGLALIVSAFLSKRLSIQVETAGGTQIGVQFKPGLLGRMNVNLDEAAGVVRIINRLMAKG
jgi:hypothetical protein